MANYTLADTTPIGDSIHLLTFAEVPAGYDLPGQFLAVQVGDLKAAWFAIASSPHEPLQLLVKRGGDVADALCSLPVGGTAQAGDAMGKGFRLPAAERPLVCLINGTGIAAVRPVVQAEVAAGLPRPVHVFYGVHHADDLAFTADLHAWREAGVQVVAIVGSGGGDWQGPRGWVQEHADKLGLVRDDVRVVLCGVKDMATDVRARYAAAGLPDDRVHTNF